MSRARTLADLGADGSSLAGLLGDSSIILPAGTTAQRPSSPVAGSIRFNSTRSLYEGYDGNDWVDISTAPSVEVQYLVIAGGAGGGGSVSGGGGAGGYRSSVSGESSGGGTSAESPLMALLNSQYTVTVGAGGAGVATNTIGNAGNDSVFATVTSLAGGAPGCVGSSGSTLQAAGDGGSGGGGSGYASNTPDGGSGAAGQGYDGGLGQSGGSGPGGGGGGVLGERERLAYIPEMVGMVARGYRPASQGQQSRELAAAAAV